MNKCSQFRWAWLLPCPLHYPPDPQQTFRVPELLLRTWDEQTLTLLPCCYIDLRVERTNPISDPIKIKKSVGELKESEDIFAFLHKFEIVMYSKRIPDAQWLDHLAPLLTGMYCEAFYNSYEANSNYSEMRVVLLDTGGYSITNCLDTMVLCPWRSGSLTASTNSRLFLIPSLFCLILLTRSLSLWQKHFPLLVFLRVCRKTGES